MPEAESTTFQGPGAPAPGDSVVAAALNPHAGYSRWCPRDLGAPGRAAGCSRRHLAPFPDLQVESGPGTQTADRDTIAPLEGDSQYSGPPEGKVPPVAGTPPGERSPAGAEILREGESRQREGESPRTAVGRCRGEEGILLQEGESRQVEVDNRPREGAHRRVAG